MGGQSGPTMDSGDFIDESDYAPSSQPIASSKTIQGGSSSSSGSASGKMMVGSGGPDSYQVVFVKDNVSVHPTQNASERISGRLRLIKQGPSLFMTWIPYTVQGGGRRGSSVMKSAEKGIFVGLLVNIFYVNCVMPSCVFTVVIHFGSRLRF
jgi:hypothetical protein